MWKHVRSWSKFPFWPAPTPSCPIVPTVPRWRNKWNTKHSSWGWHDYYYYYVLWCDVMMNIQNKPCSCSTDTPFPNTLPCTTSCCRRRDEFSLGDSAPRGLHTPLSWELLWHNLILPPHRSKGVTVSNTVCSSTGEILLMWCTFPPPPQLYLCVFVIWQRDMSRGRKMSRQLVPGSGSSLVRVLLGRLLPRQRVWLGVKR